MSRFFLAMLIFLPCISVLSQSGAVLKGGIVWKDFERDGKSLFAQSAPGFTAGIEIRLAAEERTYFKPAAYVTRMHGFSQNHLGDTRIFKIEDGYDVLTAALGLETRLVDADPIAWRMALSGYIDYVANVRGAIRFEDLAALVAGIQLSTGLDIAAFVIDFTVQRGINDLRSATENSYPVVLIVTAGFSF